MTQNDTKSETMTADENRQRRPLNPICNQTITLDLTNILRQQSKHLILQTNNKITPLLLFYIFRIIQYFLLEIVNN